MSVEMTAMMIGDRQVGGEKSWKIDRRIFGELSTSNEPRKKPLVGWVK